MRRRASTGPRGRGEKNRLRGSDRWTPRVTRCPSPPVHRGAHREGAPSHRPHDVLVHWAIGKTSTRTRPFNLSELHLDVLRRRPRTKRRRLERAALHADRASTVAAVGCQAGAGSIVAQPEPSDPATTFGLCDRSSHAPPGRRCSPSPLS